MPFYALKHSKYTKLTFFRFTGFRKRGKKEIIGMMESNKKYLFNATNDIDNAPTVLCTQVSS